MSRCHLLAGLLAVSLAVGCKAQPALPNSPDLAVNRRIEVTVRSQFNIPQDYAVSIGARKPSQFTGYDTLPVTLSRGSNTKVVEFLISTDGKTLARLETFSLTKDPAFDIDVAGRPIRGNPAAKVTVINFDDLECPYCARMHQSLFPSTLEHYKDKVRFIYKDDPLTELHPWAMHAAVDANCLAAQSGDVYWTYVDYLHSHGQEVTGEDRNLTKSNAALDRIARQEATLAKLDEPKLDACLAKQDETQVRASAKEAEALGVDGTPALFVEGERISGAVPEDQLWKVIDRALRAAGEEPPPAPPLRPKARREQESSRRRKQRRFERRRDNRSLPPLARQAAVSPLRAVDLSFNTGVLFGSSGELRLQVEARFFQRRRFAMLVLAGGVLMAALAGCHHAPSPDVMATVNGKDIMRSDLEKFYKASLGDNPQNPSPEQADIVRLNILRQLIEDEIVQQRAAKLNLAASDEDVNAKLTEMKAPITQEEWEKQLKARSITLDDLKREIRRNLTSTKLLNKEIESKINITDAEIATYYQAHKAEFNLIEPQYHLAWIVVTDAPSQQAGNLQNNKASSDADAKKKIQNLQNRLDSGEDFGAVAMNFSEDPNTSLHGRRHGFRRRVGAAERT